jgi:2-hydroxychromene-2-carboxylate isomerase
MERRIFEEQSTLEDGSFDTFAKALGLDMNRYKADLGSAATEAMLKRDHDEAEKNGLTGTPFILINGREFDLAFFHFESDLDPWIELEATMKRAAPKGPPPLLPRN